MSGKAETPYGTFEEIRELVSQFESCALPCERWTHRAHLTIALWYLLRYEELEATRVVRRNIRRYNLAHGIKETPTGGYHETITLFYVWAIARFLAHTDRDCTLAALANTLVCECGERELPFAYYSRERLMSWEARTRWVEPDVKTLK